MGSSKGPWDGRSSWWKWKVKVLDNHISFETPWTVARQASLSMGFSRQEYWNGLPFPSPGDLPNPGLYPGLLHCRHTVYHLSHKGSSGEPDTITGSLKERYRRVRVRQKVMSWWKQRERERKDLKMLHCRPEDRGRRSWIKRCKRTLEDKKVKETGSHGASRRNIALRIHFRLPAFRSVS